MKYLGKDPDWHDAHLFEREDGTKLRLSVAFNGEMALYAKCGTPEERRDLCSFSFEQIFESLFYGAVMESTPQEADWGKIPLDDLPAI